MKKTTIYAFAALAGLLAAAPLQAQELTFGLGAASFHDRDSRESPLFSAGYSSAPFNHLLGAELGWRAVLDLHTRGDAFVGVGLGLNWSLGRSWFIDASVIPGLWAKSDHRNDLGGDFQFRSALGVGRRLQGGHAVSLSVSHKSNAHLNEFNPGLETLLLQWHVSR